MTLGQKLNTVWVFFLINLKRLFRDRLALFFTFLFPLIFLFVFGALNRNNSVSFKVAIISKANNQIASDFLKSADNNKILNINHDVKDFNLANQLMGRGELDATIELPQDFGEVKNGLPAGQAIVHFTQNNEQAAQTVTSILNTQFQQMNSQITKAPNPFSVVSKQTNEHSLSTFDYTFTGLLGFAILGAGIFGPMNYFPELKKMGILRRLHTTPLKVWQYFLSAMLGNSVTGLLSIALMMIVALLVFNLKIVGSVFSLIPFLIFGIVMILGIGLALGGWAKNERQAAPLGNIVVFPIMFLSGTFFPRFLMPEWLQNITFYIPLTPVIDGARMIMSEGRSLINLGPQLAIMAVWTIVIYIIAFKVFRWE